jgi:hypothetical protein
MKYKFCFVAIAERVTNVVGIVIRKQVAGKCTLQNNFPCGINHNSYFSAGYGQHFAMQIDANIHSSMKQHSLQNVLGLPDISVAFLKAISQNIISVRRSLKQIRYRPKALSGTLFLVDVFGKISLNRGSVQCYASVSSLGGSYDFYQ